MKTKIKAALIVLLMMIASGISKGKISAQQGYVSFQIFYDQLSPYGDWVNSPEFDYIWVPDAGPDFFPYSTEGRWILTDYGWTWLSYYDWGWAPFHYGRWDFNNYYGWFWIPDNEWGPAWVSWRRADGYYGWEPMGPGISISMSFGRQNNYHSDRWIFVRDRDFNRPDIDRYYVNRRQNDRIIRSSTVINNTYVDNRRNTTYVIGPAREDIQRVTGRNINPVSIRENNKPGHNLTNDHVSLYMPEVRRNNDNDRRSTPSRITQQQDVKRPSERKPNTNQGSIQSNRINNNSLQPRSTTSPQNTRREQENNAVREKQQNAQQVKQQNAERAQQQNAERVQQQNSRREQQQNTEQVKQQNAERTQQQNTEKTQQQNSRREQQNTTRQQVKVEKRQNNVIPPKTEKKSRTQKSESGKAIKENL